MAIVNSSAIGKASGSAGPFTYRTVRGRVIVSVRITTNKSRTPKQLKSRAAFSEMQHLAKALKSIIAVGFDNTLLGSARNNFHSQNAAYIHYLRRHSDPLQPAASQRSVPLHNLWLALRDPEFKAQVLASSGDTHTSSSFHWDAENNPLVHIKHSCPFQPGDTLTFVLAITYLHSGKRHYRLVTFNKQPRNTDISVGDTQHLSFDSTTCPRLNFRTLLPHEAADICLSTAVFVITPDGTRSSSHFVAMPPLPALKCE